MKKIIGIVLSLILMVSFVAGCGGNSDRILFGKTKLSKHIEIGDYKKISLDLNSEEYLKCYDNVIADDIKSNDLYVAKTEGTVAKGDTVNIDYVGKKDGVAFEGGTDSGYDLEIGSGNFIPGFEEGLIGAAIGSSIDINLTFPENYKSKDLAGKAVVFTVKVNSVKTTEGKKPEDYYKDLGFSLLKAYEDDVKERATSNFFEETVVSKSKIKSYPEAETDIIYNSMKTQMETYYKNNYNMSFIDVLTQSGMTEADFKSGALKESVNPMLDNQMTLYSIIDNEGIEITKDDVQKKIDEEYKESGASVDKKVFVDNYGEYYFEYMLVREKAIKVIKDNAIIKK